ncbi:MAG: hypothetical protein N4A64_06570 [Marinisporobacter sp.]|jgi:hypothetical protein|nr:hypothetical protein [Marinisporobacter sp.]
MKAHELFEPMLFPNDHMEQFDDFMNQYGDKSESYILDEIARIKNLVPQETIQKYMKNLDLLAQTEGFVSNEHRRKIDNIKRILSSNPSVSQQSVTSQSFATSLLLWFLILVAIWKKPCCKPYPPKPYPPRPYPPYRPYRRRRSPFFPFF